MNRLLLALVVVVSVGCVKPVSLAPEARGVLLGAQPPDPARCSFVGETAGFAEAYSRIDGLIYARNHLRNNAARQGANYVSVDMKSEGATGRGAGPMEFVLIGRSYLCKSPPTSEGAEP